MYTTNNNNNNNNNILNTCKGRYPAIEKLVIPCYAEKQNVPADLRSIQ